MRLSALATAIVLTVLCPGHPAAQPDESDLSRLIEDERNTIQVFREAASSVVYVVNRAVQRDIFSGRRSESLRGTGSGFLWDQRGHVVTNFHVVRGSTSLSVILDNQEYQARLLGAEPKRDIAVLKIKPDRRNLALKPVRRARYKDLIVGQKVLAIGSPFGLDRTLTTGVVSALGREIVGIGGVTIPDMIQTDASINPGNSGGPLLNSSGELIGMNTMIYSKSGSSAGIGFAVPINLIRRIVPQIIKNGRVVTPGLGVRIWADDISNLYGIEGVIIRSVKRGSNAARAGLRGTRQTASGRIELGDIVIGINDKKVINYDDLYNALDGHKPGEKITVHFLRNGTTKKTRLRLVSL